MSTDAKPSPSHLTPPPFKHHEKGMRHLHMAEGDLSLPNSHRGPDLLGGDVDDP